MRSRDIRSHNYEDDDESDDELSGNENDDADGTYTVFIAQ